MYTRRLDGAPRFYTREGPGGVTHVYITRADGDQVAIPAKNREVLDAALAALAVDEVQTAIDILLRAHSPPPPPGSCCGR